MLITIVCSFDAVKLGAEPNHVMVGHVTAYVDGFKISVKSSPSFNVNASCKLRNGELMWGTNNGAVMFNPDKLYHTQLNGQIYFQNINISGSIRAILSLPTMNLSKLLAR